MVSFLFFKLIVNLLHKLGYIENYSSGLDRIFKEYKGNSEQPIIQTSLNMFKIIFPNLNYQFTIEENTCEITQENNFTQEIVQEITQESDFVQEIVQEIAQESDFVQEIVQENIQKLILEVIKNNPKATRNEIANKLNSTSHTIKYQLNKMKKAGIIKHIGSTKSGYWEIVE